MKILLISPWAANDVLTQGYVVPYIPLIQQALLRQHGSVQIDLITIEKGFLPTLSEVHLGNVHHIPLLFRGPSPKGYFGLIVTLLKGSFLARRNKYTFIQTWCATGGAIGCVLSFFSRTPLLLDSFEPHADAMAETGCWNRNGVKYKLLRLFEILQARRATAFFPVSQHMFSYSLLNYNVNIEGRAFVKPACARFPARINRESRSGLPKPIKGIYIGKFGGLYLDVDFFRILLCAQKLWMDDFSFIILTCQQRSIIEKFASEAGFDLSSVHVECVPHARVPEFLSTSDFAITSLKSVPSRLCCTPVKTGEYWAWGLPVLTTPGISVDSELIQSNGIGVVLDGLSDAQITSSLLKLYSLLELNRDGQLTDRIRSVAFNARGFQLAEAAYASIYNDLFADWLTFTRH